MSFNKKILIFFLFSILGYIAGVVISGLTSNFSNILGLLTSQITFAVTICCSALSLVFVLTAKAPESKNSFRSGKTKSGDSHDQFFDAAWITKKQLETNPEFMYSTWESLPSVKKSGIVIRNILENNKYSVNMYNPINTLIIGTTGSGKTTALIEPTIRIFARTSEKPCMVITDPKGELFDHHAGYLKQQGYKVIVLDLRKPFQSDRWNPMENAFLIAEKARNIYNEVSVHKGGKPEDFKLKRYQDEAFGNEWYEFNKCAYPNKTTLETNVGIRKQELMDDAENELREIACAVCPVSSQGDSSNWERGAQDYLYAIMLAMLEDSFDSRLGMTKNKFIPYNVTQIGFYRDSNGGQFDTVRNYFKGRPETSKSVMLANGVINNADVTMRGFLGILQGNLSLFQDSGISYVTSASDISFDNFVDQPTVFFLKIPDEKTSRHPIATICISQLYKKLIEIASANLPDLKLPRTVYFIMDEFANLPKIPKMDTIISVCRARKIFFEMAIQSYSQLDDKYGKETANTIKQNCNIQIYVGTTDLQTQKEFSEKCGNISLEMENVSESKGEKDSKSKTTSKQLVQIPLISPYELGQIGINNAVIQIFNQNPIKTPLTPWFNTPQFERILYTGPVAQAKPINFEELYYSMKQRNKICVSSSPFDSDF
ncbi:MAG: type IV secretory system conjugative DNA transfer family protein [Clostridia bacterium]